MFPRKIRSPREFLCSVQLDLAWDYNYRTRRNKLPKKSEKTSIISNIGKAPLLRGCPRAVDGCFFFRDFGPLSAYFHVW